MTNLNLKTLFIKPTNVPVAFVNPKAPFQAHGVHILFKMVYYECLHPQYWLGDIPI